MCTDFWVKLELAVSAILLSQPSLEVELGAPVGKCITQGLGFKPVLTAVRHEL